MREYCRPGLDSGGIRHASSLVRVGVNCVCGVGGHISKGSMSVGMVSESP